MYLFLCFNTIPFFRTFRKWKILMWVDAFGDAVYVFRIYVHLYVQRYMFISTALDSIWFDLVCYYG